MSRVSDLSLTVYLTVINSKKLEDTMVRWSGCDKEVYTENVLVDIYQSALSDITNAYHIPNMFYHYFDGKKTQKTLEMFGKYKYSEIEDILEDVKEKDTLNSIIKFVWHFYYITFFSVCKYIK